MNGQCPNCKDFFGSDLPGHLEHSSCAVKKAPAPAKKKMIDPHSSFRPYWTRMKIRMNYDEVGETISSQYNFLERNGFTCRLVTSLRSSSDYYCKNFSKSIDDTGNSYSMISNRETDFELQIRMEKEKERFWEKYHAQMACIEKGDIFYTKERRSNANAYTKFCEEMLYLAPKKVEVTEKEIRERELAIIQEEKKYELDGIGTFAFRELKIRLAKEEEMRLAKEEEMRERRRELYKKLEDKMEAQRQVELKKEWEEHLKKKKWEEHCKDWDEWHKNNSNGQN